MELILLTEAEWCSAIFSVSKGNLSLLQADVGCVGLVLGYVGCAVPNAMLYFLL